MYRNYLKIALRYLWRNKTYTVLNFACLTFGLSCAIVALLHILNAIGYDKFHRHYDRLYSVESYVTYFNGSRFPKDYQSAALADVLKTQVPEIEEIIRITGRDHTFEGNNLSFSQHGMYADSTLFKAFTFPLLFGDATNPFPKENSIVISEKMAGKFFGSATCIGQTLILNEDNKKEAFEITGIFKNVPNQSYLQFDFIIPFPHFLGKNMWANDAGAASNATWILLAENANRNVVDTKIKNLIKNDEATLNQELFLFPLKEKILYSYADGKRVWREMQNLVIVGCIGFAILLIACFNFINLAIALNLKRHREAGIRKILGSGKSTIIYQFLIETFVITFLSLIYAVMLVELLLKGFNAVFGADIHLTFNPLVILFFLAITLFTAFVSGIFPALYLSSSNPLNVLKGKLLTNNSFGFFRQGLIVFQFTIPMVLIICMMVIRAQDNYMQSYNLGFSKDKLMILPNSENLQKHAEAIKAEILTIPSIDAVTYTNCIPSKGVRVSGDISWEGKDASQKLHFWCINTDCDYSKVVNLKLADGRFFNPLFSSDSSCVLINDVAANAMNYENPLGRTITVDGQRGKIIGVFRDFHAIDLRGPYVPTIIRLKKEDRNSLLIRFSGSYPNVSDKLRKIYSRYEPTMPFQPVLFIDTEFSELKTPSNLVGLASILAILLACLGLFGLASFMAVSRTKEIGIRKANGASTISIMRMLLTNYARWVTFAFILCIPVAYWLGKMFLSGFFFRTNMPWFAFIIGPAIVYAVALLTVCWQSYRVANRNPVDALRYE